MPKQSPVMSCGRTAAPLRRSTRGGRSAMISSTSTGADDLVVVQDGKDEQHASAAAPAPTAVDATTAVVRSMLGDLESTATKSGWCLRKALTHVVTVDGGRMLPVVQRYGLPAYLDCCRRRTAVADQDAPHSTPRLCPQNCFESLCRIIAGQFVSGVAAAAAWKRLLAVTDRNLTPETILGLIDDDDDEEEKTIVTKFQKPAGLTRAKARSIVDLARHFASGALSEEFLSSSSSSSSSTTGDDGDPATRIRAALLQVRGIGPWSCDMFLQFYLEQSNILPLGDLGVRKGIARQFGLKATGSDRKEDAAVRRRLQVYEPYLSIVTYYMWRVVDTPDVISATSTTTTTDASFPSNDRQEKNRSKMDASRQTTASPPTARIKRRKVSRQVTP